MKIISSDQFIRQRRNLIVTALLLFLAEFYGLRYSEMNVFGNKFTLENPLGVPNILLILLMYFVIRYYQYLGSLGDLGLGKEYLDIRNRLAKKTAIKKFKKNLSTSNTVQLGMWIFFLIYPGIFLFNS